MTLLCVSIAVDDPAHARVSVGEARLAGADLIELRLDPLLEGHAPEHALTHARGLLEASPLPVIATCRSPREGGETSASDADRLALLRGLIKATSPPRYIDLELSTLESAPDALDQLDLRAHPEAALILSTHEFQGRPADLLRRIERMRAVEEAAVLKIAYTARSARDTLEIADLLAARDRPTIALAMGPFGLASRVLAPKFGGFITFAALHRASATAPAQPTIADLLTLYRAREIDESSPVYGVLGYPVEHSLSPHVHNAAFARLPETHFLAKGVYLPLPVAPEYEPFKATLDALLSHKRLTFRGGSVTIPHKENLLRFAREAGRHVFSIDPLAERAGAANTLHFDASRAQWLVTNTDAPAIAELLSEKIDLERQAKPPHALILGAGGVARAAALACADAAMRVTITNRTPERAVALARDLSALDPPPQHPIETIPWEMRGAASPDILINATSVGMSSGPSPDEAPYEPERLAEGALVLETVYNPLETPLLRAARARGCAIIDGADLFVQQAALQSTLWTGAPASTELFDRIVRERLSERR